jgi:hypothetical protein
MMVPRKKLIYFVVGGSPEYVALTRFSIYTLRMLSPGLESDVDLVVLCDAAYEPIARASLPGVAIHVTAPNPQPMIVSLRKVEVFDYVDSVSSSVDYDKILYLDSDVVATGDVRALLERPIDDGVLYVKLEGRSGDVQTPEVFGSLVSGLGDYTPSEVARFVSQKTRTINGGTFMFLNSAANRFHFRTLAEKVRTHEGAYFYDQSFVNAYYLRNGRYSPEFVDEAVCILNCAPSHEPVAEQLASWPRAVLAHVTCAEMPWNLKLHNLSLCLRLSHDARRPPAFHETREMLPDVLARDLAPSPRIAEIGVLQGDYAEVLTRLGPSLLILIDPWRGRCVSGNQDGNDMREFDMEAAHSAVRERFAGRREVLLVRGVSSDVLPLLADDSLDLVYLDGDHSHEGVSRDLDMAYRVVRPGGWVCGHDLRVNPAKCRSLAHDFSGSEKAVYDFVFRNGLQVHHLFQDGCVSFAIRLPAWKL